MNKHLSLYVLLKAIKPLVEKKAAENPKGGVKISVYGKEQKFKWTEVVEAVTHYQGAGSVTRVVSAQKKKTKADFKDLDYKELYELCSNAGHIDLNGVLRKTKDRNYYIDLLLT